MEKERGRERQTERRKDEEEEETAVAEVVIAKNEQVNPRRSLTSHRQKEKERVEWLLVKHTNAQLEIKYDKKRTY